MALKVSMRSANRKTGPIPVTARTGSTCPASCPLVNPETLEPGDGCYGHGRIAYHARRLGTQERAVLKQIAREAPLGGLVRHHEVGDVMRDGRPDTRYLAQLAQLAADRPDLRHILYTHAWRELDASALPFTMNASCETREEIEDASARGFLPVVIVQDHADELIGSYVDGRKVIVCPADTDERVTCSACGLCAKADTPKHRRAVVAFPAHGPTRKAAIRIVRKRREDVRS